MTQLSRFQAALSTTKADCAIISSDLNIRYLCGFDYTDGYLLIFPDKAYLLTDFRYVEAAKASVTEFEVNMPRFDMFPTISDLVKKHGASTVIIEDASISLAQYKEMSEAMKGITLSTGASEILREQREIKLPYELDIFDEKTFNENPLEFHIVCTDVKTGLPHYEKCFNARDSILWMRASASMPMVSRVVEINGKEYLDGGIVDAVPIKYFESIGYTKNIVILTRPYDYVKKKGRFNWIMKFFLRKYPAVYEGMKNRHKMYSETMEYINKKESKGEIIVIRPETALNVKRTERNPENLKKAYDLGRKAAINRLEEIKSFLEG